MTNDVSSVSTLLRVAQGLNWLLLAILVASIGGFISFANIYGIFLALVTALIAFGVFKYNRWGYFAAAAWGLACFQLAKQGYEFESIKRYVMIIGIILIPLALFLHEMLGKPIAIAAQNCGNEETSKKNMPE
jgi:hypothetical protein